MAKMTNEDGTTQVGINEIWVFLEAFLRLPKYLILAGMQS